MQHVDLNNCSYIGLDIVPEMITLISKKYSNHQKRFMCVNIVEDPIPCADLIFCRDTLVHLTLAEAIKALKNFKNSGSKYLLTTTFTATTNNKETANAIWRPLNIQQSPFNLPQPIEIINEHNTHDSAYPDKSLGLWYLKDIPF